MLPAVKSQAEKNYFALTTAPWYFGVYLTQAQHNLTITLNDLSKKLGRETTEDEHHLLQTRAITILTDAQAKPHEVQKAMAYYEKNFPFLFGMHFRYTPGEKTPVVKPRNLSASATGYAAILKKLIQVLHDARAHYLHAEGNRELPIDPQLFYWLNDAFDINARIVKRKMQLNEQESNHLRRYIANYDRTLTDKLGKPLKVIPNPAFNFYFNKKDNRSAFTTCGLAFFTCLFLNTAEAWSFLKRINEFQSGSSRSLKATFDTFCINNLQTPKERFSINNNVNTLLTDMCNELAKAPKELFETLHPDKQKLFITAHPHESTSETTDQNPVPETKMIRKNNRFTFFAQRFLDITNAFQHLRFGVDLGYYYYSIYPKTIAGIEATRELTKRLTGYGRLEDFEKEKRPAAYRELFIDADDKSPDRMQPYIAEAWPHYHVENNLIPIAWNNTADAYWPSLQTAPTNGQKSYPNKYIKTEDSQKPIAWLSVFELPALLFYELIQQDISAEKVITDHITGIKQFFNNIKKGTIQPVAGTLMPKPVQQEIITRSNTEYNNRWNLVIELLDSHSLKPAHIPEKILNYLLGIVPAGGEVVHEKAAGRLQTMISECRQAIQTLDQREKEEIKPGKKSFKKIFPGKLAETLATDMLLLQPPLKDENNNNIPSSKPNSTAFRLLQSHLAYFAEHKTRLDGLFKACRLTDSPNAHPFLQNMLWQNYTSLSRFYKAYFTEKINWLEKCLNEKNYADYHFLKMKEPACDIINLVDAYLNTNNNAAYSACNLPRGLFYDAAVQYLKQYGSAAMKQYAQLYETTGNAIHLINYYFQHECHDAAQNFYRWPRQYEVFKEPFEKDGWNDYYTTAERAARWQAVKNTTTRDKNLLAQQRQEAEREIQEFKKDIKNCRDLKTIARYVVDKFGTKYPAVKRIQVIRFKDYEIPRKIVTKVVACIEDALKSDEIKAKAYTLCKENEQYLRLTEVQDKLMFLCIKKLAGSNEYLLQQITAPNDAAGNKSVLHIQPGNGITIVHPFYKVTDTGEFETHHNRRIKAGEVTIADRQGIISNTGQIRKLTKDKRLNNLCFYFEPNSSGHIILSKQIITNELQQYERQRLAVLELTTEFEAKLFEKHGRQASSLLYTNGIQQHRRYLAYYFARYDAGNENIQVELSAVRTGFLYNRFPYINNQQYRLSADEWDRINNGDPAKDYGIIEKIAAATIDQYNVMIQTLESA
jgi:hypothetical protein